MVVGGNQAIEPTVTNEDESAALGVPLHSPAFLFERTTQSADGEIVEYVRSIYRGDRYRLVEELDPAAGRRVAPPAWPPSGASSNRFRLVLTRSSGLCQSPGRGQLV